ncbi:hypothetical protein QBC34DRAFT_203980 [Podospora aff. communis PSN243]|uniref:Uncharacterized protein n=1 Tax=Podospora aff. communis PSN243 TaxID=3040156 RepID=A0AAV9GYD2_9PEZI|nr:hypothetical protein QBC34DRAFT_203980 [Podospora aff. communis PSN243]
MPGARAALEMPEHQTARAQMNSAARRWDDTHRCVARWLSMPSAIEVGEELQVRAGRAAATGPRPNFFWLLTSGDGEGVVSEGVTTEAGDVLRRQVSVLTPPECQTYSSSELQPIVMPYNKLPCRRPWVRHANGTRGAVCRPIPLIPDLLGAQSVLQASTKHPKHPDLPAAPCRMPDTRPDRVLVVPSPPWSPSPRFHWRSRTPEAPCHCPQTGHDDTDDKQSKLSSMCGRSLDHSRLAFVSRNPPTVSCQETNLKRTTGALSAETTICQRALHRAAATLTMRSIWLCASPAHRPQSGPASTAGRTCKYIHSSIRRI